MLFVDCHFHFVWKLLLSVMYIGIILYGAIYTL
jgi:hypothetical protein